MSANVEQAAKELLRLQAELEALEAQKKDFRLDLAEKILPAEVITAATVTVEQVDKAKVKAYAEALGLLDGCLRVSEPFVTAVRSRHA